MSEQYPPTEVSSDDRLWVMLGYILTPWFP
jgi:hypothetical protein